MTTVALVMKCMLCPALRGETRPATGVLDGASLCDECAADVVNRAPHIWFAASDDRFHLVATIEHLSQVALGCGRRHGP